MTRHTYSASSLHLVFWGHLLHTVAQYVNNAMFMCIVVLEEYIVSNLITVGKM